MWPEFHLHERWQQQLASLMRGPVPCRIWVMRDEPSALRLAAIDWSHPGLGKVTTQLWEREANRARGSSLGNFQVGRLEVSFTAGATARRTPTNASSATISASSGQQSARQYVVVLDEPIRVCTESAALLALMCEAIYAIAFDLACAPVMHASARDSSTADTAADSVNLELHARIDELDAFQSKVLELICSGWTNTEIATATRMSLSSVRAATSAIYERLDVRNRHEAAALCGAAFTRRPQLR